jgi:hypothetical protein
MGQNEKPQRKSYQISHGTPRGQACGPGLLYSCRESFTNLPYFLQNKANFQKSQLYVKLNKTKDYEKKSKWTFGENKPNQSQFSVGREMTEDRWQTDEDYLRIQL